MNWEKWGQEAFVARIDVPSEYTVCRVGKKFSVNAGRDYMGTYATEKEAKDAAFADLSRRMAHLTR